MCFLMLMSDVTTKNYIHHESYMMEQLGQLSQSEEPMSEWRRRMLLAQSLRPTRRSVMPDIYRHFRVSEWTQQSHPWMPEDDDKVSSNWNTIETFLDGLGFREDPGSDHRTVQQRHALAEHVPLVRVLNDLLVRMWFSWRDAPNFSAMELAIQWYLRNNSDATAAVYRMAAQGPQLPGGGRRRRRINPGTGQILELFQGADPVSPRRLRGSRYPGDRRIHPDEALTVQIHDLDLTDSTNQLNLLRGHVPAISVWVPPFMRADILDERAP